MLFSIILSYLPYTLVTAFTPGPNNIVSLYAISQQGWRRGKDVVLGIAVGFLCVMLLCAVCCYQLAQMVPALTGILKYVGAAYIIYLAIHVACSRPADGEGKQISFVNGFLLQFMNVKIILYAITVYTAYVLPYGASFQTLLIHVAVITVIGVSGTITWAIAGGVLQRFLQKYYRPFNIIMALILLWCAGSLLFA